MVDNRRNPSYPYAGGNNPVPEDDWDSFEPDPGFAKIELKNAFFDTSLKTFGASPNQVEGAEKSYMFMKDHQGFTWFYGTIFQQAMIPDGLFPGEDPFVAAASESLQAGQLSMLVNDKNQNEVFPAVNEQGEKITYYFIEDPWGNEYIAQGANTSDVNSAAPGSAEALAELFSSSVLPDGWSKSYREFDEDFVLDPATGSEDSESELKYNAVSDHQSILYYQSEWSEKGKLPAMLIDGMPSWNNDEDGVLKGNKLSNDLHGAGGKDLVVGKKGDDFLYGNNGDDTLKGGHGNDVLTGGPGADVLVGGGGQNTFGDEQDGENDVIKVKQDQNPDRIKNLDQNDRIQIKATGNKDDLPVTVTLETLEAVGESLLISLADEAIAYFTGDSLTADDLVQMIEVI
ncbi:calcium-binding protein [Synechococcus sp. CC9616]|uniref:calcium-binding protein n=1 Tax=Synechococcus sp. CC9616 TaxID=110663 RepID=UPI00048D36DF|nr:calcium-binding protein [Synechococcus sp. CC9616]